MLAFPIGQLAPASPCLLRSLVVLAALVSLPTRADDVPLRAAVAAESRRSPAPWFERTDFLARPAVRSPRLSPDGRAVAYLHFVGERRSLWLLVPGEAPTRLLPETDAVELEWSRDGRWLFLASPDRLSALSVAGQEGSGVLTPLGGLEHRRVLGIDTSQPAGMLVSEQLAEPGTNPRDPGRPVRHRLLRFAPGQPAELLFEGSRTIVAATLDARGRPAFLTVVEGADHVILALDSAGRPREATRCTPLVRSGCKLLSATADGRAAYLSTYLGGDRTRLVRLEARLEPGTAWSEIAAADTVADLDEVTLDPMTGEPRILSWRSVTSHHRGLDPEASRHLTAIEAWLPGRDLRVQLASAEGTRWLVSERSGGLQGERLHLYDLGNGKLEPLFADGLEMRAFPLPETALARKIPFSYRASDGRVIHGFVLVPPGRDPAAVPLVADIHGGPWNHVGTRFEPMAQFLVNRGYAVFLPNFRGSSGHGREYLLSSRDDFGNGRVQADIVDGVRHLLDLGIGDPRRVGIMGASFGGYSALLGVTYQPEIFQVAVAFMPPPDFGWARSWNARHSDASLAAGVPLAASLRAMSIDPEDRAMRERLYAQSPLAGAAGLRRPLLVYAGGEDERVAIRSVLHYAATLESLGKDIELYVQPEAGHSVDDPTSREAQLYLLEATLYRHLGGATPPSAPSLTLAEHLERHRRLPSSPSDPDR